MKSNSVVVALGLGTRRKFFLALHDEILCIKIQVMRQTKRETKAGC